RPGLTTGLGLCPGHGGAPLAGLSGAHAGGATGGGGAGRAHAPRAAGGAGAGRGGGDLLLALRAPGLSLALCVAWLVVVRLGGVLVLGIGRGLVRGGIIRSRVVRVGLRLPFSCLVHRVGLRLALLGSVRRSVATAGGVGLARVGTRGSAHRTAFVCWMLRSEVRSCGS